MKIRFTIARKLGLGFGILIGAILINSILTYSTLTNSRRISEKITSIYSPSLVLLEETKFLIMDSKALISNWIFVQSNDNAPEKNNLRALHDTVYPQMEVRLKSISGSWEENSQKEMDTILYHIDSLFEIHETIMGTLNNFESYDDPMIVFEIRPMMEEGGAILTLSRLILKELDILSEYFEGKVSNSSMEMISSFEWFKNFIIIMAFSLIVIGLGISIYTITNIRKPIQYLKNILLEMARGLLPENKLKKSTDEIGEMSDAVNQLIESRKETANFAVQIGKGNLETDFTPLSEEDELGNSLLDMRSSLKKAKDEEERRKIEDEKRSWATQGLAKFAEILRNDNDDISRLSYNIIHNLVEYVNANVGGLFILSDDIEGESYMELTASYAYDRRKYLKKKVYAGEGLVGACFQEQQTIYITEVPNNYINITSGLGTRNPNAILIVPLKLNDEIYGVIELASFKYFEPYVIDFVERIGESIASTISSVRINMRTAKLLEQSQQQAEEMRAQEEEMRQNMEELHATQEEMSRKNSETQEMMKSIDQSFAMVEFDMTENLKEANNAFFRLTSLNQKDVDARKHRDFLSKEYVQSGEYDRLWEKLRRGESHVDTFMHPLRTKKIWTKEVFAPIRNADGTTNKVLCFLLDITDQKILEESMQHRIDDLTKNVADNQKDDDDDDYTFNKKNGNSDSNEQ